MPAAAKKKPTDSESIDAKSAQSTPKKKSLPPVEETVTKKAKADKSILSASAEVTQAPVKAAATKAASPKTEKVKEVSEKKAAKADLKASPAKDTLTQKTVSKNKPAPPEEESPAPTAKANKPARSAEVARPPAKMTEVITPEKPAAKPSGKALSQSALEQKVLDMLSELEGKSETTQRPVIDEIVAMGVHFHERQAHGLSCGRPVGN